MESWKSIGPPWSGTIVETPLSERFETSPASATPADQAGDSRRLGWNVLGLGLCAFLLMAGAFKWWNRPGPLPWTREAPVRLVAHQDAAIRIAQPKPEAPGAPAVKPPKEEAKGLVEGGNATGVFQVDPNQASEEELCALPAIGPVLAKRIMEARKAQPFSRAEDLRRVSGIGPKTLEKIRPHLRFE